MSGSSWFEELGDVEVYCEHQAFEPFRLHRFTKPYEHLGRWREWFVGSMHPNVRMIAALGPDDDPRRLELAIAAAADTDKPGGTGFQLGGVGITGRHLAILRCAGCRLNVERQLDTLAEDLGFLHTHGMSRITLIGLEHVRRRLSRGVSGAP